MIDALIAARQLFRRHPSMFTMFAYGETIAEAMNSKVISPQVASALLTELEHWGVTREVITIQ